MDKVCFKCGKIKSIDEFYKHPKMKDGHFNKCKECAKKDVHDKYNDNIKNPDFVDKERERGRESIRGLDMQVSIVKIIKQNLVYIKV